MSPCENYRRHETECRHRPRWRLVHRDGCTLHWCVDCIRRLVAHVDEISELALTDDRTGLSVYAGDRTCVEAIANALLLREPVIAKPDPADSVGLDARGDGK